MRGRSAELWCGSWRIAFCIRNKFWSGPSARLGHVSIGFLGGKGGGMIDGKIVQLRADKAARRLDRLSVWRSHCSENQRLEGFAADWGMESR